MGLPEVIIEFRTRGTSAIQRSSKGVVAMILKDATGNFDTKIYKSIEEVESADWTSKNKDYIDKVFMGTPTKIIIERVGLESTDYNSALARLKNKKWNYLTIPELDNADVQNISTWIKTQRNVNKKTFKAVLANNVADDEGIINFTTNDIEVSGTNYTTSQYSARLAGIFAGMSLDRSSTYYALNEVTSIKEHEDPDADIDAGQLILINDGEKIKIGRGVNSLTTTTATKGEEFKKIKIVDAIDLMRDDIRDTFEKHYVGKVNNIYDNKILFLAAVNAYFKELERDNILDPTYGNIAEINIDAQRNYLLGKGYTTVDGRSAEDMTEQEIKEANTGSKVFAKASIKFVDTMEDLEFYIYM
jgi:hypothetical protein